MLGSLYMGGVGIDGSCPLSMVLTLEGNRIGSLGLIADGLNQYNDEHARLVLQMV
jgi:hypothetical protein